MKSLKSVIFDLDGTLIDSAPSILSSYAAILRKTGITPQIALTPSIIGPPLGKTLELITGISDPNRLNELTTAFKTRYDELGVLETTPFPGIAGLLQQLLERGIELHLCTNKRITPTERILKHLVWTQHFSSIYALDIDQQRYPDKQALLAGQLRGQSIPPDQSIYVGDTFSDGAVSTANGLTFYYAAWGYGNLTRTDIPNGWIWVDSPAHLFDFLCKP